MPATASISVFRHAQPRAAGKYRLLHRDEPAPEGCRRPGLSRGDLFRLLLSRPLLPGPAALQRQRRAPLLIIAPIDRRPLPRSSRRGVPSFISMMLRLAKRRSWPSPSGTILVSQLLGTDVSPKRWREVAHLSWQEVGGSSRLTARVENGRVVAFATDDLPVAFEMQRSPAARSDGMEWAAARTSSTAGLAVHAGRASSAGTECGGGENRHIRCRGRAALLDRMSWATSTCANFSVDRRVPRSACRGGCQSFPVWSWLDALLRAFQLFGLLGIIGGAFCALERRRTGLAVRQNARAGQLGSARPFSRSRALA